MATAHAVETARKAAFPIHSLILNRWSPRAMTGEPLAADTLKSLFEAARWAPSSYNGQPWRFLYARRGTPAWDRFFSLLVEFNQSWAKNAAALVVVVSRRTFEHNGKPARTHSFDAGAAWENLALEGSSRGLVVHGMEGFDYDRARTVLSIPEEFHVEAMIAIGKPGPIEALPEGLREGEAPSSRKPVEEIAWEGGFRAEPR